ncbi:MAG: acetyl-CoA C-acyltransferase, partial [Corynebacterium sp.]|nr:acetyl-CoA C-acyltransferase [Corynebacterium sp.]
MGTLTDGPNSDLGISREQQDEVAAASHQRAAKAQEDGIFAQEIAPIEIPQRKGDPVVVDTDQGIRPETTVETLAKLRPVFLKENGTITAGNSSPISDGAAAVVLASRAYAEKHGLDYLAVVGKAGQTAGPDNSLHAQPADSLKEALRRAEWDAQELDFIEINEAFGAVAVKSLRELDYPLEKTNIHGGAIALGHPIGCSGARLTLTAAMELNRRGSGRAGVSLCGGGGQGDALLLYRD